jgi:hypothetical protein
MHGRLRHALGKLDVGNRPERLPVAAPPHAHAPVTIAGSANVEYPSHSLWREESGPLTMRPWHLYLRDARINQPPSDGVDLFPNQDFPRFSI